MTDGHAIDRYMCVKAGCLNITDHPDYNDYDEKNTAAYNNQITFLYDRSPQERIICNALTIHITNRFHGTRYL
ncbi:hypothetical protein SIN01_10420 [Sporolactobacillus inulinus]|nr:hypothetical protein SIN01_10420 [Sporolactobacillus inulinus]